MSFNEHVKVWQKKWADYGRINHRLLDFLLQNVFFILDRVLETQIFIEK